VQADSSRLQSRLLARSIRVLTRRGTFLERWSPSPRGVSDDVWGLAESSCAPPDSSNTPSDDSDFSQMTPMRVLRLQGSII
jgi:hypothetical protein